MGIAVLFIGEIIRFWSAGYIKKYRTYQVDAPELITYGPYAYVRNPLYIGNFFIGLGVCVMSNLFLSYPIFFLLYFLGYSIIIPLEEDYLKEKWKEEYEKYMEKVNRIIPKFLSYKKSYKFDFYSAFSNERSTFLVELIIIILFALKIKF